jgi:hypothetical protein
MQYRQCVCVSLISAVLAGCGSGSSDVVTDPSQLKPLTEAEKAEIKKQDEAVAAEEGQSVKFGKKAK